MSVVEESLLKSVEAYPPPTRGRLVVWGLLASFPFGGMTWQALHHLVGLRRLGFDVWYVEDTDRRVFSRDNYCRTSDFEGNVEWLAYWMRRVGLGDRWIFRPPGSLDTYAGSESASLKTLYAESDAVLNLTGSQELRPEHSRIRCLVYIQTDPVADQIKVAREDKERIEELDAYEHLFTYGHNIGSADCPVPVERYDWIPTRPPVCVDWWDTQFPPDIPSLTTVTTWRHTGKDVTWRGQPYAWSKEQHFLTFIDLPARAKLPLELALGGVSESEREELNARGWRVIRSSDLSNPMAYRDYIRRSLGEFAVAKDQVVRPRSGWFSDRSVCYLAAGRPVVLQDTAFGNSLPTGEGLFAFSSEADALAAIEAIADDYPRHSAAAREIAREYFDANNVLGDLLRSIGML